MSVARHSGNAKVATLISAIRCAKEGNSIAIKKVLTTSQAAELAELYEEENASFYDSCVNKLMDLTDEVDEDLDTDKIIMIINVAGLLLDRVTKRELMSAPGVESDGEYERTPYGIQKTKTDGTVSLKSFGSEEK